MKSALLLIVIIVLGACCTPVWALGIADFETGVGQDGQPVGAGIPGFVFATASASAILFADITTGFYNVRSDDGHTYGLGDYFVCGDVAAYVYDQRAITRIDVTSPAPGIKVGYTSSCPVTLEAFDSNDQKIGTTTGLLNMKPSGTGLEYLTLTPTSGLISYVTLKADIPTEGEGFWMIDNVQVVPEPTSVFVLASGLGAILLRRRRTG
jgi:hypothetical protein